MRLTRSKAASEGSAYAERRRAMKIHGQYPGRIRRLKPAQKAQVKAAKAKGGYRAAIAMATLK